MFSGSYRKSLECETDPGNKAKHSLRSKENHLSDSADLGGTGYHSFELCTPNQMFKKASYPFDPSLSNPFCPVCGKFVERQSSPMMFESTNHHKIFLAHERCLTQEPTMPMNGIFDDFQQGIMKSEQIEKSEKIIINLPLGGRQFYTQIVVSHPLSDYKFFKIASKVPLIGSKILWQLGHKEESSFCFLPNIICLPMTDFKLTVFLSEIGVSENKTKFQVYINLGKKKQQKNSRYVASSEEMSLYLDIIEDPVEKLELIDSMNFKYSFDPQLPLSLIKFNKIDINIPDDFDTESEEFQRTNSNINFEDLLKEKNPLMSPDSRLSTKVNQNFSSEKPYGENHSDRSMQSQDGIDLQRLIETGNLKSYVCNNVRSRLFQNFLKEASPQQIDLIIQTLSPDIAELTTNEYANYMIQKLFTVCNLKQRISIMKGIRNQVPTLIKNKQGTHTIQSFIGLFVSKEEFEMMCGAIQGEFIRLSCHANSTHFVQKVINIFPMQHTLRFFKIVCKNFLTFATDKNAMCVLKHQMKKIKQFDSLKEVSEIKKQLIRAITINTDNIIQDSYGNYIVQFCFELFGTEKSTAITQMIIARFAQFSIQRYSSSVVLKCITKYWTDIETIENLKFSLSNQGIIEMYRNRDGSKVLLEIMQKYEHTLIREKIYTLLIIGEPTRFYQERWGVALGSRSGQVGTQFTSFSEAAFGTKPKSSISGSKSNRKKYNR